MERADASAHCLRLHGRRMAGVLAAAVLWVFAVGAATASPQTAVVTHEVGQGAHAAWVFVPGNARAAPSPVVIFMHGYRALDPYDYGGWIDHLVRRGNVVIYPIYENTRRDDRDQLLAQAAAGIRNALVYLRGHGVEPDRHRFAVAGHSLGGGMSVLIAARARQLGLPPMRAAMPVQAGSKGGQGFPKIVFAELPPDLMLLVVDGDRDQFHDSRMGAAITAGAVNVPAAQKRHLVLQSDDHADPPLIADHYAPLSPDPAYRLDRVTRRAERRQRFVKRVMRIRDGEVDALDTRALWPLFDRLMAAAFAGKRNMDTVLDAGLGHGLWVVRRDD